MDDQWFSWAYAIAAMLTLSWFTAKGIAEGRADKMTLLAGLCSGALWPFFWSVFLILMVMKRGQS